MSPTLILLEVRDSNGDTTLSFTRKKQKRIISLTMKTSQVIIFPVILLKLV